MESSDLLKRAEQEPKNLEIFMLLEHNANRQINQQLLDENIHSQIKLEILRARFI